MAAQPLGWPYRCRSPVTAYESGESEVWPVTAGMQAFDSWLDERGYTFVGLDCGWDAYVAVAVPDEAEFVRVSEQFGISTCGQDDS